MSDESPGYAISPARVPLGTLTAFASDVQEFLLGSERSVSAELEVAVVNGSLAIEARNADSPGLLHDLKRLASGLDLTRIDPKRRSVIERWQLTARDAKSWKLEISGAERTTIVVSNVTDFHFADHHQLVNVERYIRGEVVKLGGAREPTARIRLANGKMLTVHAERETIRAETENHLYRHVHVRIRAKLDIETGELSDARLVEFVDYSPGFDEQAFEKLTSEGTEAWKDVDDPAEWVRNLRGTSE
ncbi:hypothetical protein [Candidatus Burkholderia verschuerenii]|uniref:hypothetical protein n=1 Tax=Candidatus Burkholderia verschuerenii TaxID=242163 RepID=UPI0012EE93F2|nr:hypothetical protein [Candidatus Burkholderia verschuerenii]